MRYVLTAFTFIAIGLAVLTLWPTKQPLKSAKNLPKLPVESARNDVRDVTPETALPGPKLSGELLSRLPDKIKPKPKIIKPRINKYKNLIVTSAGILSAGDTTLQIRNVNPLKLEAVCQTENDEPWPCGRFARTAMRHLILRHAIECEPTATDISPIVTKCLVGSRDVGKWLVQQGWAKSDGETYAEEMATAKENHRGQWRKNLP